MEYLPLSIFFMYSFGFGFAICKFLKESDNFLERNLTRIGAGLCIMPIVGVILSILHIPVDWKIFLPVSLIYPTYYLIKNYKNFKFNPNLKFKRSDTHIFLIIIVFILVFYMYHKGSFAYPYLEDDDSWSHSIGAEYVAVEKTFFNSAGGIHYLDPYPPAYDGIMGLLRQTSSSLLWTLKFFNALVISLSILFFYLFVREFTENSAVSLFSSIALAMIPAYMSHFIWAHALIPGFIFLSFLFLERIKYGRKWICIAAVAISAIILTSITQFPKFMFLFFIYFACKCAVNKRFVWEMPAAAALGFLISLLWWAPLAIRHGGILELFKRLGLEQDVSSLPFHYLDNAYFYLILITAILAITGIFYFLKNRLPEKQKRFIGASASVLMLASYIFAYSNVNGVGTADRIYDFNDFFIAHSQNMINNPIGLGIAVFLLFFITLILVIREQFSIIREKKDPMPKIQFYFLYYSSIINSIVLAVSSFTFFLFRLKPGALIKQWMLRFPENYNYVYSFSFKVWGVYTLIASLIFIAVIYIFLIYKEYITKQKLWVPISLLWTTYSFAGLYDIPTQFFTFRVWAMLAFALSIFLGYGFMLLLGLSGRLGIPKIIPWTALIALIFFTSGIQKYSVNTAIWPPGGFWTSNEEIQGYMWLKDNIPPQTRVFTFSNDGVIIGFDKFVCHWCGDVKEFQKKGFNGTAQDTYNWLKSRNYEYVVIDGQSARKFGVEETNNKVQNMLSFGKFSLTYQTNGFLLLRVA